MKLVFHRSYGDSTPPAHLRNRGDLIRPFTLVLDDIPTREQVLALIPTLLNDQAGTAITFKIGASVVHPKDQFNRKEGLRIAESKLGGELFQVRYIAAKEGNEIILGLSRKDNKAGDLPLTLIYLPTGRPQLDPKTAELIALSLTGILPSLLGQQQPMWHAEYK